LPCRKHPVKITDQARAEGFARVKLHDCRTAPSPRRVRIFLAEKGLALPTVQVDLRHGEQLTPAFRAPDPWCTVPVLELDDGTAISEAIAVCHYPWKRSSPSPR
jgi:glutathione S-transferase